MKKCVLIYNPIATGFNSNILSKITAKLLSNYDLEIVRSAKERDVINKVVEYNDKCDIIITMGGDGTIGEAMQGFLKVEQHALYAHIPSGTTNDFAINMKMPRHNPVKAVDHIIDGGLHIIDLITVNEIPFAYVSSYGYLTNLPYDTPRSLKEKYGYLGHITYAIEKLKDKPFNYNISFNKDGNIESMDCVMTFVSNSIGFAGVKIFKDCEIADGLFEVSIVKDITPDLVYQMFGDFIKGNISLSKYKSHIVSFKTDNLTIKYNVTDDTYLDNDGDKSIQVSNNDTLTYKIAKKINMIF